MDTHSGGCGAGHRGNQNRAGRPNAAGRVARVSGICAARALSVVSGDLLRDSDDVRLCSGRRYGKIMRPTQRVPDRLRRLYAGAVFKASYYYSCVALPSPAEGSLRQR